MIPPIINKTFRYHIFSETLQWCSQNFSALWDHVFSTEKCDAPPLFIGKNFSKPEIFSKTVGFLYNNFRHRETNKFRRKIVTPLLCIKFFDYRKVWNIEGRPTLFSPLWDLKVSTEKRDTPNMHNFSRYHNFSERLQRCLWFFFGSVRPKIFDGKMWYALFHLKTVPKRENLSKTVGINYKKKSALWDRNFLTGKRDTFYHAWKIPITPNFLKPWTDAYEFFRHCETWNFRQKNVIPPILHIFFQIPQFFWNFAGILTKFFINVRQIFSTEKCDTPSTFHP